MPSAQFPSDDFPALSGFRVDLEDGWTTDPAAGMQFAARPAAEVEGFMPNLIGSVKRRRRGAALAGAVQELDATSSSLTDYAEVGRKQETFGDHPGFRIEFSFRHSPELTLAQMVTLIEVDRGVGSDLIQLTSTCAGDQVQELWPAFRAMHASAAVVLPD